MKAFTGDRQFGICTINSCHKYNYEFMVNKYY